MRWRRVVPARQTWRMANRRRTGALVAVGLGATLAWAVRDIPKQMGGRAKGSRLARMERSPQFSAGRSRTRVPASEVTAAPMPRLLAAAVTGRERRHPHAPIPVVRPAAADDPAGLSVIWYGHSSALIEIEGRRV